MDEIEPNFFATRAARLRNAAERRGRQRTDGDWSEGSASSQSPSQGRGEVGSEETVSDDEHGESGPQQRTSEDGGRGSPLDDQGPTKQETATGAREPSGGQAVVARVDQPEYPPWPVAREIALQNVRWVPSCLVQAGDDGRPISPSHVRSLRASGLREWPTDTVAFVTRITKPLDIAAYRTCEGGHRSLLANVDLFPKIKIAILGDDFPGEVLAEYTNACHFAQSTRPLNYLDKLLTYLTLCKTAVWRDRLPETFFPSVDYMVKHDACEKLGFSRNRSNLQQLQRWAKVVYFHWDVIVPRLRQLSASLNDSQSKQLTKRIFVEIRTKLGKPNRATALKRIEELEDAIKTKLGFLEDASDGEIGLESEEEADDSSGRESSQSDSDTIKSGDETAGSDSTVLVDDADTGPTSPKEAPRQQLSKEVATTGATGESEDEDAITPVVESPQPRTPGTRREVERKNKVGSRKRKGRRSGVTWKNRTVKKKRRDERVPVYRPALAREYRFSLADEKTVLLRELGRSRTEFDYALAEASMIGLTIQADGVYADREFDAGHRFPVHGRILRRTMTSKKGRIQLIGLSEVTATSVDLVIQGDCFANYVRSLGKDEDQSLGNAHFEDNTSGGQFISEEFARTYPIEFSRMMCERAVSLCLHSPMNKNDELVLGYSGIDME